MATRGSEKLSAAYCFKTFYDALVEFQTAVLAETGIAALLAGDYSSTPPTAAVLNTAKTGWDSLRNNAAYEGNSAPTVAQTNLWTKVKDEAGGGTAVCTSDEKYAAYYELKSLTAYLTKTKTDIAAQTDVAALMAINLASTTPTAVQLSAAKTGWNTIRNGSIYVYGGCRIPAVNVDTRLWTEIDAEAAA